MRIAGGILTASSALLMVAPVWVWAQRGEGGWQLALAAVVVIAGGMLAHTLVALGVCITLAWAERRFAQALIGAHVIAIACGGIILTANSNFMLAAHLTAAWAVLGVSTGVWLARR
ncbi:MAG TPA: hypothetical protein VF678_05735 [bacterium]